MAENVKGKKINCRKCKLQNCNNYECKTWHDEL